MCPCPARTERETVERSCLIRGKSYSILEPCKTLKESFWGVLCGLVDFFPQKRKRRKGETILPKYVGLYWTAGRKNISWLFFFFFFLSPFLFVLFVDFPPVCNKETPLTQTNRISVRTHRHDLQETCIIFFRLLNLFLFFFLRSFFFFLFHSDVSFLSLGLFDDREKKEVGIQPV